MGEKVGSCCCVSEEDVGMHIFSKRPIEGFYYKSKHL